MIRDEIVAFCKLGPLPSENDDSDGVDERLEVVERLLLSIRRPVSDGEAHMLLGSFGEDNCFGMAWTLLHTIEIAPGPAVDREPRPSANPWILRLWRRYLNSRHDSDGLSNS